MDPSRHFEFVRLPTFERTAAGVLSEEDVRALEARLIDDPRCGAGLVGGGGIRKLRVSLPGRGRSGGARVVYFFVESAGRIYLLYVFAKNERDNLSAAEKATLKKVADLLREEG